MNTIYELINKPKWFKEICEVLGEKPCKDEYKVKQLDRWKLFMRFDIVGRKIIILEVFDDYIPPEPIKRDNGIYSKNLKKVIRSINIFTGTKNTFYEQYLGINLKNRLIKSKGEYNRKLKDHLNDRLMSALKRLKEDGEIFYCNNLIIRETEYSTPREATIDEIIDYEEILESHSGDNRLQVFYSVNEFKEKYGYDRCWTTLTISNRKPPAAYDESAKEEIKKELAKFMNDRFPEEKEYTNGILN